jgi:diguanylate cyclase (GGDEF)-like protein
MPDPATAGEVLIDVAGRAPDTGAPRPAAAAGDARVVLAGGLGSAAATVVEATLVGRLGTPEPAEAPDLAAAEDLLPADLLVVDAGLALARARDVARLRRAHPRMVVIGMADEPDETAVACMRATGIDQVLVAGDGRSALALRLRRALQRAAGGAPPPVSRAERPSEVLRGLARQLEQGYASGMAEHVDRVTGLPDRAAWEERLEAAIARARGTGEPVSLLLLDVDGFGAYNERFGRAGGDALLTALGRAWRRPLREDDLLARIGADEFGVLLPRCTPDDAEAVAERLNAECVGMATFAAVLTTWDGHSGVVSLMARAEWALARVRSAA